MRKTGDLRSCWVLSRESGVYEWESTIFGQGVTLTTDIRLQGLNIRSEIGEET